MQCPKFDLLASLFAKKFRKFMLAFSRSQWRDPLSEKRRTTLRVDIFCRCICDSIPNLARNRLRNRAINSAILRHMRFDRSQMFVIRDINNTRSIRESCVAGSTHSTNNSAPRAANTSSCPRVSPCTPLCPAAFGFASNSSYLSVTLPYPGRCKLK